MYFRSIQLSSTLLAGYGMKNYVADIQTKTIIFQLKAKFFLVTYQLEPEIRKMLVTGMFGNGNSTFHLGP